MREEPTSLAVGVRLNLVDNASYNCRDYDEDDSDTEQHDCNSQQVEVPGILERRVTLEEPVYGTD